MGYDATLAERDAIRSYTKKRVTQQIRPRSRHGGTDALATHAKIATRKREHARTLNKAHLR